ncbi:MAG: aldehyde dehydrogenase [Betaproteobacteria bacterium]|nr:aldehyde dehydrogenase [Betaproteobacteria bacterium]
MGALMSFDRREIVKRLLSDRGDLLVVSALGAPTYDVAACGDASLNFYLWGAMGGAAMVGLGLALALPDRSVAVITGDGEMLMGLGSLATIGVKQPANLAIVVLDNEHYGETGMQASHTHAGIDLSGIAQACRFKTVISIAQAQDIENARRALHANIGPVLVHARVGTEEPARVLPSRDGQEVKLRFMQALKRNW